MTQAHDKFILKSGGTLSKSVIEAYASLQKRRHERLQAQQEKSKSVVIRLLINLRVHWLRRGYY